MARGAYTLARVAVTVRAAAVWLWWLGVVAAVPGTAVTFGPLGRGIGALVGAALFVAAALAAFWVRGGRYGERARDASRAAKSAFLQDRRVTVRAWLRRRRLWLALAFLAALGLNALLPCAAGMLLAGLGAGLFARSLRLACLERTRGSLFWIRPDGDPAAYQLTGIAAGDAGPGGGRRRSAVQARAVRRNLA